MEIGQIQRLFWPWFRRRRMMRFLRFFTVSESTRILDVGGTPYLWDLVQSQARVTMLNVDVPDGLDPKFLPERHTLIIADGRALPYRDNAFDIIFSNSVIEHMEDWKGQMLFAGEMKRVARQIWLQTPAKSFFFETHAMAPFVHWLSKSIQRRVLRNFTPWGWITRPDNAVLDYYWFKIRLLTFKEIRALFPDGLILRERFMGFTKSYLVVYRK
jgi:hypothetical protein